MRIGVTGATGFIGRALVQTLLGRRDEVIALTRNKDRARGLVGPNVRLVNASELDAAVDGTDAVINLAGEPILGRWTAARKRRLVGSRVDLTRQLVASMDRASIRPHVLVSASAVGIFQGGFLQSLCADWEAAAREAEALSVRVVLPRIGLVLEREGDLLGRMAPVFRLGLGGRLGSGKQWMPWIHLNDLIRLIVWGLDNDAVKGAISATAPHPVTNAAFTKALGKARDRPTFATVPVFLVKLALGAAATLLLDGPEVRPTEALAAGFAFDFERLEAALSDVFSDEDAPQFGPPRDIPPELTQRGLRPSSSLVQSVRLEAPIDQVFDVFSAAENLGVMTPAWMGFRILSGPTDAVSAGDHIAYRIQLGPLPMRWLTEIQAWVPRERFVDNQLKGPYSVWWHEHSFEAHRDHTIMRDRVYFKPPLGPLGRLAEGLVVRPMLRRVFGYRATVIRRIFPAPRATLRGEAARG
ncbi:MAG: hypothetical protein ACI9WU_005093 [Myxococcota bacterium]|jgi:uncharacterized protein (TIGR01777 family)